MLIAAGQGIVNLRDLTNWIDTASIEMHAVQGDPIDTFLFIYTDQTSQHTLATEDDLIALDETDAVGWPTVNVLLNAGLEAPYIANIPSSWIMLSTGAGITYSQVTTSIPYPSTAALGITLTSPASLVNPGIQQTVRLAVAENLVPFLDIPYCLSAWLRYTGANANVQAEIRITWQDVLLTTLSEATLVIPLSLSANGVWRRYSITALPPSATVFATVKLYVRTLNASATGMFVWDNLQFERCTFGGVTSLTYPVVYPNPSYQYSGTSGVIDGYLYDQGPTYILGSVSTSINTTGSAQVWTINNLAVGSYGITLTGIPCSGFKTYTMHTYYSIPVALNNARVLFSITARDSIGNVLATQTIAGPINEGVTAAGTLNVLALHMGIGGNYQFPVQTITVDLAVKLVITAPTNSGAVLVGLLESTLDIPVIMGTGNLVQTALQAGLYPTPYVGVGIPAASVHQDIATTLFYRQLRLFGGYIRSIKKTYQGVQRHLAVKCVDYGILLQEAPATLIVTPQQDTAAINLAVTYGKNQGGLVGIDTNFITPIETVGQMIFTWATTKDVLTEIANQTVGAYWVDPYKILHYTQNLANSNVYNVSDTPDGITSFPFSEFVEEEDSTQTITVKTIEGAPQLSSPQTASFTGTGTQTVYTVNGGNPIITIDSLSIGGTLQAVGLTATDTFGAGYTALVDVSNGRITLSVAPAIYVPLLVVFRFQAPLLIRKHAVTAESLNGGKRTVRRRIHHHQKHERIVSQAAAISRATADLAQYQRARPVGELTIHSPPWPISQAITVGQALSITHRLANLNQVLYQVQEVTTRVLGNGIIVRKLKIGHMRPDLIMMMSQMQRDAAQQNTTHNADVTLNDLVSASDQYAYLDSVAVPYGRSVGIWGPTTTSTYGGVNVWG